MAHLERRTWSGGAATPHNFPVDVQRLIFEIAARRDRECALQLVLVARHVRTWIDPILYECIIVRAQREASSLLETMRTKPRGFFDENVRSLAFGSSVTFQQAKPILAECSTRITDFAVWGANRNPSVFLPFVRSPNLRRLSLKSQNASELNIPPAVLSSLTHLIILDGPYAWYHLRNAIHFVKSADTSSPDSRNATAMFQSLTHFGVCSQNWGGTQAILKVAKNLKYFAVIVPPHFKASTIIGQRIAELGDRRVVLVEYSQTIENWETSVCGGQSIWDRVEKLVADGRFSEQGEENRWPQVDAKAHGDSKPRTGLRSGA